MALSGFYYDIQKQNPLMSVTLHANAVPPQSGDDWDPWPGEKDTDGGYGIDPLCTALMSEDFGVSIANNWSEFDAGNMLESAWNSIRPAGAYMDHVGKLMDKMVDAGNNWLSRNTDGSGEWAQKLNSGINKAREFLKKDSTNILNHALVVQGTRFSYYAGTGNAFSNLNMKFTLFADWKDGSFVSVHDQLENLYPYIMGQYVSVGGSNGSGNESSNSLDEFFGWQKAPGGFKPDIKNIDKAIKGTLKLKFGSYYSIRNLVVRDAQLNFSKQMVKVPVNPDSNNYSENMSPLFCDIMLSLQPATKFSDTALREFVRGSKTEEDRSKFQEKFNQPLTDEMERIKGLFPKRKDE